MELPEEEDEEWEVKTLVWWHINSCPIPSGYNTRLVGPAIESALKKTGLSSDHITITAVRNLKDIPGGEDVLRDLCSTGISLRYALDIGAVQSDLMAWASDNQTPGTIMLICGPFELEVLASMLYNLDREEHVILVAHSGRTPDSEWLWKSFLRSVYRDWPWESLLKDEMVSGSADNEQEMRSSEKDGSPIFCSLCDIPCQSFQGFITHLKCKQHTYRKVPLISTLVAKEECVSEPLHRKSGSSQPGPGFDTLTAEEMRNKRKAKDEEEEDSEQDDERRRVHGQWGCCSFLRHFIWLMVCSTSSGKSKVN